MVKDRKYLVTPLTDHHPTTNYELLDDVVQELSKLTDFSKATKILGEEERGGYLAALVAYANKLPFGMVKWNPNGLGGQLSIDFRMSYAEGKLYLNGIEPGDKVIIVEDMIDSGGTMVAMINIYCRKQASNCWTSSLSPKRKNSMASNVSGGKLAYG